MSFSIIWGEIQSFLDRRRPGWQDWLNNQAGQVSAVEARELGYRLSDKEIFEGIVKAVLSNNTVWKRIEGVLPDLRELFDGFDLRFYAKLSSSEIEDTFLPWFEERYASSQTMKQSLIRLIQTANKLLNYASIYNSLEGFLAFIRRRYGNDPITLVTQLGATESEYKLPAMGIPIAAEAAKNIGFDVAKPDRHINRAMGSFKLIKLSNWPDRSGTKAPQTTERQMLEVMRIMKECAREIKVRVTFLDNAIWLLCSKSGLYLDNQSLRQFAECRLV